MSQTRSEVFFQRAVDELNGKNLDYLWRVSSLLSGNEYFSQQWGLEDLLFPMINLQVMTVFDQAILESNCLSYKTARLNEKSLRIVVNSVIEVSDHPEILEGPESGEVKLLKLLATMANFQFRFQEKGIKERMGRVLAYLQDIPLRKETDLKILLAKSFVNLPSEIPLKIGLTVEQFLLIGFCIIAMFKQRFQNIVSGNSNFAKEIQKARSEGEAVHKRAQALTSLVMNFSGKEAVLGFRPQDLILPGLPD